MSNIIQGGFDFESTDCTGEALTQDGRRPDALLPPVVMIGTKFYAYSGESRLVIIHSQFFDGACHEIPSGSETSVAPIAFLLDLSLEIEPPFSVR